MEELSAVGFMQLPFPNKTSVSLGGPAAAKLAELPSLRGEQEVPAAARLGVPRNSSSEGTEVIEADCGGSKTARRRWLEPTPSSVVVAETGQTGPCTGDVDSMCGLPAGLSPQGELVAEIRWLLVRRKGVRGFQRRGAEQAICIVDCSSPLLALSVLTCSWRGQCMLWRSNLVVSVRLTNHN